MLCPQWDLCPFLGVWHGDYRAFPVKLIGARTEHASRNQVIVFVLVVAFCGESLIPLARLPPAFLPRFTVDILRWP
jgi:hypothetical protein